MNTKPRVAILGAGPIGLEAALTAAEKNYPFTLYEASPQVAGHVRSWGHVRLFTPWELDVSPRMRRALATIHYAVPEEEACPTGADLVETVLRPISELPPIRDHLRLATRVHRVGRKNLLKHEEIGTAARAGQPFRLLVVNSEGRESFEEADVVLDCTGNSRPNTLGDGGIPALGEEALDGAICRNVPNLEHERSAWSGRSVLLVGAGHSAQTALLDLVQLARDSPGTHITWALRRESPKWGRVEDDPLPERSRLIAAAAALASSPPSSLTVLYGVVAESIKQHANQLEVTLRRKDGSAEAVRVERILSLTGRVGDYQLYRQLQVHECYATSGPMQLAAALMGSMGGDCMAQTSQGAEALRNPEAGFFILGSKSYGRRSDFLMRVGWQQVDEVFQLLEQ